MRDLSGYLRQAAVSRTRLCKDHLTASIARIFQLKVYANVMSVNVGLPREVHWRTRSFTTAIVKEPVLGQRRIEGINVVGDDQADRSVHGGRSKALYAYSSEDYAWWSDQLHAEMYPGLFGENLTNKGIDPNAALIGE